jgi:hypothetical protein
MMGWCSVGRDNPFFGLCFIFELRIALEVLKSLSFTIRAKKMSDDQATEYHKNSMRNVRSALNRHMKDIGRLVDIVKDNDFKTSNAILRFGNLRLH